MNNIVRLSFVNCGISVIIYLFDPNRYSKMTNTIHVNKFLKMKPAN